MKDLDKQRDQELDAMLASLRGAMPKTTDIDNWSAAVEEELVSKRFAQPRRMPRVIEWAIAASVGFFIALAFGKINAKYGSENEHDGMNRASQEIYSGVDATEMKLIAIHE